MGLNPAKTYVDLLGDGIEALQAKGTRELDEFVAGLNDLGVPSAHGKRWTAAMLAAELARLSRGEGAAARAPVRPVVGRPFTPATPSTAEDLLRTGLLDLWYLVATSNDVTDRPIGLKRLGRNLVLWRDDAGDVHVLEDYCPHRGAPLSLGRITGGRLSCAYHGFEIDAEGTIVAVPATPGCALVGLAAVRPYPVRELNGAIFVYFSDRAGAVPPEPVLPEEFTSPEYSSFIFTTEWECNWQVTLDNRVDPLHGSFLHSGTFTLSRGRQDSELKVEPNAHGFETVRNNQRGLNIDWHEVEFHPGNILWVRTEIPYPDNVGGGSFRINGHPTPIDENRTFVWFHRSRKISGWKRDMWRFLYLNRLEERSAAVVEQDRVLLEAMSLEARSRENLAQSDVAVGRMRRLLREEAQRQIEARTELPELSVSTSRR
jgi:phenylpropionate dioxygenase-like ring-hydroxylating dioxygenase large terminal subunit